MIMNNMKNKLALVFCVHHKPWLIMSTLISTLAQGYRNMDLFFIYQKGNGSCEGKRSYDEYRRIAIRCGVNPQLSDEDARVNDVCKVKGHNVVNLEFENDHALDSGAWYKFIKTGLWKNYERVFFIQEGSVFTSSHVLESAVSFSVNNGVNFISSGHEKQRLPRELVTNLNRRNASGLEMDIFHDRMIADTFGIFRRDKNFDALYEKWSSDIQIETQNHTPDMGREYWFLTNLRNKIYEMTYRAREKGLFTPGLFRNNLRIFDFAVKKYEQFRSAESVRSGRKAVFPVIPYIVVNTKKRRLTELVGFKEENGVRYHLENGPEWFGCSCQHLLSRKFLESFSGKIEEFKIYDVLELPFSGSALEIIWGFLPSWLGYDKWFFDGIHRVRKNFFTYEREDNADGMAHYLNWYYRGMLNVVADGDFIKIKRLNKDLNYLKNMLCELYFR